MTQAYSLQQRASEGSACGVNSRLNSPYKVAPVEAYQNTNAPYLEFTPLERHRYASSLNTTTPPVSYGLRAPRAPCATGRLGRALRRVPCQSLRVRCMDIIGAGKFAESSREANPNFVLHPRREGWLHADYPMLLPQSAPVTWTETSSDYVGECNY